MATDECAVCGVEIDSENPPVTILHQGETHHCCCGTCEEEFKQTHGIET